VSEELAGRRVVVLGGGRQRYGQAAPPEGIGQATCVLAAKEGARVAIVDRDAEAAKESAAEIAAAGGAAALPLTADCTDEESLQAALEVAASGLGGIDGLVINVGIGAGNGFAGTSAKAWDTVLKVNVRSHFLGCKLGLPLLSDGGSIVLVSSVAATYVAGTKMPAYAASKAALSGLVRHAAKEGAPRGIRANVVAPGFIDTPLGRSASRVDRDPDSLGIPLARQGTAAEIANAIVFMLSARASYVTAQELVVDGGLSGVGAL
jgi:NAD(P)-dependent dehydrogenase (short-subunit alcohol dehydrogenase family)